MYTRATTVFIFACPRGSNNFRDGQRTPLPPRLILRLVGEIRTRGMAGVSGRHGHAEDEDVNRVCERRRPCCNEKLYNRSLGQRGKDRGMGEEGRRIEPSLPPRFLFRAANEGDRFPILPPPHKRRIIDRFRFKRPHGSKLNED